MDKIVQTLKTSGMWKDTLFVFSTDNGGDFHQSGNNHPLRGNKNTNFEGGTHGVAFVAGGYLQRGGVIHNELFHITDWYPTLLSASGSSKNLDVDGVDQWSSLNHGVESNRKTMVYNLNIMPVAGAIRVGPYKLMFAPKFKNGGWYDSDSSCAALQNKKLVFKKIKRTRFEYVTFETIDRKEIVNQCNESSNQPETDFDDVNDEDEDVNEVDDLERRLIDDFKKTYKNSSNTNIYQYLFDKRWPYLLKYLFNIAEDPGEQVDLKKILPDTLEKLRLQALNFYGSFIPRDLPKISNKGLPKHFDGVWSHGWC